MNRRCWRTHSGRHPVAKSDREAFRQARISPVGRRSLSLPTGGRLFLYVLASTGAMGLSLLAGAAVRAQGPIQLQDVTGQSGIAFKHTDGSSGRRYLVEAMSAGLATFDYDGDGLIDIYFVNGVPLPGMKWEGPRPRNALYRNVGGFHFVDATEKAGIPETGFGLGVAVADYDNDGWQDVYISNFGPNVLLHNRGDGTLEDVTAKAGVGAREQGGRRRRLSRHGRGTATLDLFVANYIRFSYSAHKQHTSKGLPIYPGPLDYSGETANLFRNRGDGTFADVSVEAGIATRASTGMGITCADYDSDGRTDVFVANDEMPNLLYHNEGAGRFDEVGLTSGVAFDVLGLPHGCMGVDAGDYDNDGRLDFVVTAYQRELTTLYRNQGGGLFTDYSRRSRSGAGSFNHVKWGVGLVDFDNDGHRDLFIACGHVDDNAEQRDDTTSYFARNVLLAQHRRRPLRRRLLAMRRRHGGQTQQPRGCI